MSVKTTLNYSPNFNPKKRSKNRIKFIIIHYTGMKTESDAVKRLTDSKSEVSAHYLIKTNGEIVNMVPDLYIAWHAGRSFWKKYTSLNKNSIGIEITNPGHDINYKKFTKIQIKSLIRLCKFLLKKYKIKPNNVLGHSDVAPDRKKDPGEKFPWKFLSQHRVCIWHKINNKILLKSRNININIEEKKIFINNLCAIGYSKEILKNLDQNKKKYFMAFTIAFQRRFRPELVNGKLDKECLLISKNLVNK